MEPSTRKQNFLGENPASRLILYSREAYARIEVRFGGNDAFREPLSIEAADFIGVKVSVPKANESPHTPLNLSPR